MKRSDHRSRHVLHSAPWFDERLKNPHTRQVVQAELQKTLQEYQHKSSMREHPQYGLWKLTTALVVVLFLVIIGTSLYTASPTGFAAADQKSYSVASNVSGALTLIAVILLIFSFLILLFYRQLKRQIV